MKNLKKVLLFLTAVSSISFGSSVKKDDELCKDKNNNMVKCPVKVKDKGETLKKNGSKQNNTKSSGKIKTEGKEKERSTSSK
ncbi:hypothetical protein EII29_02275 [Leptotrichia sp. OH3620_COT-345]|uniref:hypothetical protein n=1 Tax=Leptotrichia sp. OH3620_COT-345 TaxID=2491048 RepID=UPI000F6476C4|nr:hypothetical protein [Leptotrichia sp. OH3620_COT-345]RRD40782.1 hypothetical protein EII29_02275 [Leptotrichia sp. OH3620_COT-345]